MYINFKISFENKLFSILTADCLHLVLYYFSTEHHNYEYRQNIIILLWKYLVNIRGMATSLLVKHTSKIVCSAEEDEEISLIYSLYWR